MPTLIPALMPIPALTERQTLTLQAAVDCIVPADDTSGGWEGGAGEHLTRLLTQPTEFLHLCRRSLDALDAQGFLPGDRAKQNALLASLETDSDHSTFFRLLVTYVMEGYYTGEAARRMLGFQVTA